MAFGLITSQQIDEGKVETVQILFSWASKSLQMVTAAIKLKDACFFGRKAMTNLDNILKNRHYFANKGPSSQSYGFSGSHV